MGCGLKPVGPVGYVIGCIVTIHIRYIILLFLIMLINLVQCRK